MEKDKISIIIPIYKVEKYLPQCLDSLMTQTYQNLEILLIDDGSPDGCGRICDDYATKDPRFVVIHKKNAGVAAARNDGLEKATGDFISFADSDDWLDPNAYTLLYGALISSDADCAVGSCQKMLEAEDGTLKEGPPDPWSDQKLQTGTEAMERVLLKGSAIWNRVFRRSVFSELRFPIGRINDDEVTALHAYALCKKIIFLDEKTYYYRIRANSITTSAFSLRDMDYVRNSRENLDFVRSAAPTLVPCAEFKVVKTLLYCSYHLRKLKDSPERKAALSEVTHALRDPDLRKRAWKNPYLPLYMKLMLYPASL